MDRLGDDLGRVVVDAKNGGVSAAVVDGGSGTTSVHVSERDGIGGANLSHCMARAYL